MKTLSVLLTLALFLAANGLAVWLKHASVQPPAHQSMVTASKTPFYHVSRGTNGPTTRTQFYE